MDIIGSLDRVVAVMVNSSPPVAGGGHADNYTVLLTTRAKIRPQGGSRGISFGDIIGNDSYKITVRYQAALWSAIKMKMKFVSEDLTYTMQSWDRVNDGRKSYIEFSVTLQRNG